MKTISWLAGWLLLISATAVVAGEPSAYSNRHKYGLELEESILAGLELTAQQAAAIRVLRESFEKDISPLRAQKFEKSAELRLLWRQTQPALADLRAKQREIYDLKWQIVEIVTEFRLSFRNLLTAQQLTKLIALEAELTR